MFLVHERQFACEGIVSKMQRTIEKIVNGARDGLGTFCNYWVIFLNYFQLGLFSNILWV